MSTHPSANAEQTMPLRRAGLSSVPPFRCAPLRRADARRVPSATKKDQSATKKEGSSDDETVFLIQPSVLEKSPSLDGEEHLDLSTPSPSLSQTNVQRRRDSPSLRFPVRESLIGAHDTLYETPAHSLAPMWGGKEETIEEEYCPMERYSPNSYPIPPPPPSTPPPKEKKVKQEERPSTACYLGLLIVSVLLSALVFSSKIGGQLDRRLPLQGVKLQAVKAAMVVVVVLALAMLLL